MPYASGAYRRTHPGAMATLAELFGMSPRDIHSCRVLEIGCANGANLIPMACTLPQSTFVGIDLSARQITEGQGWSKELKLENITLHHLDLSDLGDRFGAFDYIIAHGIYSWVPAEVRESLLAACCRCLTGQGVAYISYNTNPGWRMRGMLRDMMLYHSRKFSDVREQIGQGRALIEWLAEVVRAEDSPYGMLLRKEVEQMKSWRDGYFRHDSLAEVNEPVYFHEFMEQAGRHGLQYLGESSFPSMYAGNYDEPVNAKLHQLGADIVELEQYMDFVRNRMFRETLLCHRAVPLNRILKPESLVSFHFGSGLRAVSAKLEFAPGHIEQFRSSSGLSVTTNQPIAKAAFLVLSERDPEPVSFAELLKEIRSRLEESGLKKRPGDESDGEELGSILLQGISRGFCEIHRYAAEFQRVPSERPKACPVASWQAGRSWFVTNRRHECLALDELPRQILSLLDGRRQREDIVDELVRMALRQEVEITTGETVLREAGPLREILKPQVEENLRRLGQRALLIA
jgi:methyltransferase-like protein/2-polyprenyl-3-methyl-5-hydroxy-6-metoxy-1,4-benzoquinol methylase